MYLFLTERNFVSFMRKAQEKTHTHTPQQLRAKYILESSLYDLLLNLNKV